jgi:hypothetical protein
MIWGVRGGVGGDGDGEGRELGPRQSQRRTCGGVSHHPAVSTPQRRSILGEVQFRVDQRGRGEKRKWHAWSLLHEEREVLGSHGHHREERSGGANHLIAGVKPRRIKEKSI